MSYFLYAFISIGISFNLQLRMSRWLSRENSEDADETFDSADKLVRACRKYKLDNAQDNDDRQTNHKIVINAFSNIVTKETRHKSIDWARRTEK